MSEFNYEFYTIEVLEATGRCTWEIKAKNAENAAKQIRKAVERTNKTAHDKSLPWLERGVEVLEVYWDTMKLDRIGYQRLS